jgi:transposase
MGEIERIEVPPEDRERLERLVRDRNTPQKIVWRSQIVLLAGEGIGAVEVATRVGKSVLTVQRWRRRYATKGADGLLKDATRPPGRRPPTARKIKQVVNPTLNEKPPDATHWSQRMTAARAGIAPSSVHKIWAAHGLKRLPLMRLIAKGLFASWAGTSLRFLQAPTASPLVSCWAVFLCGRFN